MCSVELRIPFDLSVHGLAFWFDVAFLCSQWSHTWGGRVGGREGEREGGGEGERVGGRERVTGVHVVSLCCLQENSLVIHSPIPATFTHWDQVSWSTVVRYAFKRPQWAYYKKSCNTCIYNTYCLLNSNSKIPVSNFWITVAHSVFVCWTCVFLFLFLLLFTGYRWGVFVQEPITVHIGQELTGYVNLKANERFVSQFACVLCFTCVCVCLCVS